MPENVAVVESLTREELYEKVWSQPIIPLARSCGIPTPALTKICRKLNIPTPGRGYWSKKKLGLPMERIPLTPLETGEEKPVLLNRVEKPAKPQKQLTETERKVAAEKKEENRIVVAEQLIAPHPLIEKTQRSLSSTKADSEGRVRPEAKGCLGVCVGPNSIGRAMQIMDALIKALEARGYVVTASNEKEGQTRVHVSEESIHFSLVELVDRREKELTPAQKREREKDIHHLFWSSGPEYDRFPSGRLSLSINDCANRSNSKRTWSDGVRQRVEDRLNSFVASLIRIAEDMKRSRLEAEERARIWKEQAPERERLQKEEEQRRRDEEQRKREEECRVKVLESTLPKWQHVEQLRAFVAAVRAEAIRRYGDILETTEVAQWLTWAEGYATAHDPLAAGKELPTYSTDEETRRRLEWNSNWGGYSSGYAWSPPGQPR